MSVEFLFFHFKNPKRALGGGEENFQRPGGEKRSPTGGGGERRTVDGDGEAPTCSKWVGFPRLFFLSWLRLLRFPSDMEIVSIFW